MTNNNNNYNTLLKENLDNFFQYLKEVTTYEITEITTNKITFTGIITTYQGYATEDDIGQPYNIEATLELINGNWIITKNIKK